MSITCDIELDNADNVYYVGQLLRGTVHLTLAEDTTVYGIYIRIFGNAYAQWMEHCPIEHDRLQIGNHCFSSKNDPESRGHHVPYTGKEVYLDEITYFVGETNTTNGLQLESGTQVYNFQCLLPSGLPTSFDHPIGHIIYGASVIFNIPMQPNIEFTKHFTVIKAFNLNRAPLYRVPITAKFEETFYLFGWICCLPSGPLRVDVDAPVRGYAPGQTINVEIDVSNDSNEVLSSLDVQLIQEIVFHGQGMHRGINELKRNNVRRVIMEEATRGCGEKEKDTICANLKVPSVPPTDWSANNVIQIKYLVRISGTIDGNCCRSNIDMELPITIGTYPIRDDINASAIDLIPDQPKAEPANSNSLSNISIISRNSIDSSIDFDSDNKTMVPFIPVYEEGILASASTNNFKPKYPIFNCETSYSINRT